MSKENHSRQVMGDDEIDSKPFRPENNACSPSANQSTSTSLTASAASLDSGFSSGLNSGSELDSASSDGTETRDVPPYQMNYARRRRGLIFCNTNFEPNLKLPDRRGYEKDIDAIKKTFEKELKFEFFTDCMNLTASEMFMTINAVCQEDHSGFDALAVFILSHGSRGGQIFGVDEALTLPELFAPLHSCKSLVGKPKLVFVQACRGSDFDRGIAMAADADAESQEPSVIVPVEADFLFAHSTVDGYVAFNNPRDGSWFIQALCDEFRQNWRTMEIMEMLTRVNYNLAYTRMSNTPSNRVTDKLKQVSSITTTLTKPLYFHERPKSCR